jgi:hypothetical protein
LTIAATAITAGSQIMAGIASANQANYAAEIADRNAKISAQQANDATENTKLEAQRRYRALAETKGRQQAAMAANGVDINFGTAVDIQRDTAMLGAEDIGQIYKAGNEQAVGFDREAWNNRAEASAQRSKAKNAKLLGFTQALGTVLGGASQVSKMRAG